MNDKLILYKPINPFVPLQCFGEEKLCVDITNKNNFKTPEEGKPCPSGFESYYKSVGLNGHDGMDITASSWQPVYASCEGLVKELQTESERGLGIGIISENKYLFPVIPGCPAEGKYYAKTRYWHLAGINVKSEEKIQAGQLIGWADNTGYSSGTHLHFELKPVDRGQNDIFYNVYQDNGYYGSVDPLPFIAKLSALEINSLLVRLRYFLADKINHSSIFN